MAPSNQSNQTNQLDKSDQPLNVPRPHFPTHKIGDSVALAPLGNDAWQRGPLPGISTIKLSPERAPEKSLEDSQNKNLGLRVNTQPAKMEFVVYRHWPETPITSTTEKKNEE